MKDIFKYLTFYRYFLTVKYDIAWLFVSDIPTQAFKNKKQSLYRLSVDVQIYTSISLLISKETTDHSSLDYEKCNLFKCQNSPKGI